MAFRGWKDRSSVLRARGPGKGAWKSKAGKPRGAGLAPPSRPLACLTERGPSLRSRWGPRPSELASETEAAGGTWGEAGSRGWDSPKRPEGWLSPVPNVQPRSHLEDTAAKHKLRGSLQSSRPALGKCRRHGRRERATGRGRPDTTWGAGQEEDPSGQQVRSGPRETSPLAPRPAERPAERGHAFPAASPRYL